ncbi:nuclear distribution protein nudE homolog 1-like isoform X2 [Watersipora subatra]|uniref:nuclear distribution protein nudE homolog 1-like isoform X2 n=1 Tax=Watersipora subatra TaxID=2589382 RepID=UPI00355BD294
MPSSEDIEYWKNLAEEYNAKWQDAKEELDEYQQSSQELESEMELQLEQSESKVKELTSQNERLETELDTLRERFEQQSSTDARLIGELQDDLAELKGYKRELEVYIRELEQMNDDLQRAKRETVSSLQDFESKLNQAIERNAFLESELDDRDYLMESVQRLKDEARDLRQELDVTKKKKDEPETTSPAVVKVKPEVKVEPSTNHQQLLPNTIYKENQSNGTMSTPSRTGLLRSTGTSNTASTPLTPTARISALNIVGDLLRKVGALETKLNAVKNTVSDQSPMTKHRNLHLAGTTSHRHRRDVRPPSMGLNATSSLLSNHSASEKSGGFTSRII